MKSLSMTGGPVPRAKPGDYERSLALLGAITGKETKARLIELRDATAAHDKAREEAEAATAKAAEREKAALKAEGKAVRARQTQADEGAAAMVALGMRESAVTEREKSADVRDKALFARKRDIDRRVKLLTEAGVVLAE